MIASEKFKQVASPRKRVASTKRMNRNVDWSRAKARAWLAARIGLGLFAFILFAVIYREISSSRSLQLRTIEVSGNSRVGTAEVERLVRQNVTGTLLGTNLG